MLEVHFDEEISLPHKNGDNMKLEVKVRCWKGSSVKFKDLATFSLELSGVTHGEQTKIQGGLSVCGLDFSTFLLLAYRAGQKSGP